VDPSAAPRRQPIDVDGFHGDAELSGHVVIGSGRKVTSTQTGLPTPIHVFASNVSMDLDVWHRAEVLASVAQAWKQPDHSPREAAVHELLRGENTYTAEATAFALNQLMASVTPDALRDLVEKAGAEGGTSKERHAANQRSAADHETPIAILEHGAATPTSGVRELCVLALFGVSTSSVVPVGSPALIPSFTRSLQDAFDEAGGTWNVHHTIAAEAAEREGDEAPPPFNVPHDLDLDPCTLAVTEASGSIFDAIERRNEAGAPIHHLARPSTRTIGVIDGSEPEDARQHLAQDALLHEGVSPRCLKILWAPRDLTPDPILEAMAEFRGVVPAHDATPGALEMQRAFLEAIDQSHAYAAGLQFLMSRGNPEAQQGAHLRWAEYNTLDEVGDWLADQTQEVLHLVARRPLHERLSPHVKEKRGVREVDLLAPGEVHRPPLATPRVRALVRFLSG